MEYFHIYILSLLLFIAALIFLIISFINEKTSIPHILFWLGFLPATATISTYTCSMLWSVIYTAQYQGSMQGTTEALLMLGILFLSMVGNLFGIVLSGVAAFKGRLYRMWFVPLIEGIILLLFFLPFNNPANFPIILIFPIQGLAFAGVGIAMAVLAFKHGNTAITGITKLATASLWFSFGGFASLLLVLLLPSLKENNMDTLLIIANNIKIVLILVFIIAFTGATISMRYMVKKFSRSEMIGLIILIIMVALGPAAINIIAYPNNTYRLFYIPYLIIVLGLMIFLIRRHDLEKVSRISLFTGIIGSALIAFSAESILFKLHA